MALGYPDGMPVHAANKVAPRVLGDFAPLSALEAARRAMRADCTEVGSARSTVTTPMVTRSDSTYNQRDMAVKLY